MMQHAFMETIHPADMAGLLIPAVSGYRGGRTVTPTQEGGGGGGDPESELPWAGTTLTGVGSEDDSFTTHPPVANTTEGDWFVDASVGSSGDGTSLATAFKTLAEGLSALGDGETLLVKAGTYNLTGITRSTVWTSETRVMGYGTDRPVLDFTSGSSHGLVFSGAENETWHGFELQNISSRGVYFTSSATDNKVSQLEVHDVVSWALNMNGSSARNQVLDSVFYRIGDGSTLEDDTDVVAISYGSNSSAFIRNFVANGPDDGVDLWDSSNVIVKACVSYGCGRYWNGNPSGEGNGFKMGSGSSVGNQLVGVLSIKNEKHGVQNNSSDQTEYRRNTFYDNGQNASTGAGAKVRRGDDCVMRDNVAAANLDGATEFVGNPVDDTYNSWNDPADAGGNSAFPLTEAELDFADAAGWDLSLDTNSEGIDAGVDGGHLGASETALRIAKYWIPALLASADIH